MIINGKEVGFSISNLKHAGALEAALKRMDQKEKTVNSKRKDMQLTEVIQVMINTLRDFFVDATGVDVLEGCEDFLEARRVYTEFLNNIQLQKESLLSPFSLNRIE